MESIEEREAMAEFLNQTSEECDRSHTKPFTGFFKLVGLSAGKRFTCSNIGQEDIFWAESGIPEDRYNALFKWAKSQDDFWKQKVTVKIEHMGLYEDKTPRNPVVVEVIIK